MGRSMGSGPTCALAADYPVQALILLSPYTSLKQAVKTLLGSFFSMLVRERFENIEVIKKVRCPTLIIHGQADTVIHESHAIRLHENCGGPSKLIMPATMTHNDFEIQTDLIKPIQQFFAESNVVPSLGMGTILKLKRSFTIPPVSIRNLATKKDLEQLDKMIKQLEMKRVNNAKLQSKDNITMQVNPAVNMETSRANGPTIALGDHHKHKQKMSVELVQNKTKSYSQNAFKTLKS